MLVSISFISEKIMNLDVLDNKPDQPKGRLVVFMSMNEAATVVYSTAVWWVYSPAMFSDAWCLVTSPNKLRAVSFRGGCF